jgi:hypothetical protein
VFDEDREARLLHTFSYNSVPGCQEGFRECAQADGEDAAGMCISHFDIFQADNETYFKEYEGELSFATDAWTSPNHKAFIAVTVHFENNGEPMYMLLDMVEVAELHSGVTLAAAFARVLEDFGISDKVSQYTVDPN